MIPVTEDQVLASKWNEIRRIRDHKIAEKDWLFMRHHRELRMNKKPDSDNPTSLSMQQIHELDSYIQALADLPQTFSSPYQVVWPTLSF